MAGPPTTGMTFDSKLLKPPQAQPTFDETAASAAARAGVDAAPSWRSSARDIEQQCIRVLRCTAQALAAGAGGLRFRPGSRPWLAGLDLSGAMRAGEGAGGGHASLPEPLR